MSRRIAPALLALALLASCGRSPPPAARSPLSHEGPWLIRVEGASVAPVLRGGLREDQYNGSSTIRAMEFRPGQGMAYLVIDLSIERREAGGAVFAWRDLSVRDWQGRIYPRLADDSFLGLLGLKRISSIDLNFGSHRGSICFELPLEAAGHPLTLVHEAGSGREEVPLGLKDSRP